MYDCTFMIVCVLYSSIPNCCYCTGTFITSKVCELSVAACSRFVLLCVALCCFVLLCVALCCSVLRRQPVPPLSLEWWYNGSPLSSAGGLAYHRWARARVLGARIHCRAPFFVARFFGACSSAHSSRVRFNASLDSRSAADHHLLLTQPAVRPGRLWAMSGAGRPAM